MPTDKLPQVPFGAVYFRKSNPPREDWARDYGVAAEDGLNIFRHWFMWGAIERRPGYYEWDDYDRQMDLAAKNGIKTVIAELIHAAPDWAIRKFAHARQVRADGRPLTSNMGVSAATGGFANNGGGAGALSLNCDEVKEAAGDFLTALATRYKGHPGLARLRRLERVQLLAGSRLLAPTARPRSATGCAPNTATSKRSRRAWNRYSYAEWDDIEPPREMAPYPECLDWLAFKRDNYYGQMQWRIDTIRARRSRLPDRRARRRRRDPQHGVAAAATTGSPRRKVELYGFTWIAARKGNEPWQQLLRRRHDPRRIARQAVLARRARRAARCGCSRRCSAATRRTGASPIRKTSGCGP